MFKVSSNNLDRKCFIIVMKDKTFVNFVCIWRNYLALLFCFFITVLNVYKFVSVK